MGDSEPPVSILFASFLGYNPIKSLLGSNVLSHLPASSAQVLTGRSFFPALISDPFRSGLHIAFTFSIVACLVAAAASWSRGRRYVAAEQENASAPEPGPDEAEAEAETAEAFSPKPDPGHHPPRPAVGHRHCPRPPARMSVMIPLCT